MTDMHKKQIEVYYAERRGKMLPFMMWGAGIGIALSFFAPYWLDSKASAQWDDALKEASITIVIIAILFVLGWGGLLYRSKKRVVLAPRSVSTAESRFSAEGEVLHLLPQGAGISQRGALEYIAYSALICLLLAIGAGGVAALSYAVSETDSLLGYILLGTAACLLPVTFHAFHQARKANYLVSRSPEKGITLSAQGIRVSIALMEGPYREMLIQEGKAVAEVPWRDLSFISIESSRRQGNDTYSPTYYKFILKRPLSAESGWKQDIEALFVYRKYFYGREKSIVDYLQTHSGLPVALEDKLR
jgi:hypothetical protein